MNITEQIWNSFVTSVPSGSFLQSWQWGEMQGKLGVPYWRLTEEGEQGITGAALVVARQMPMGRKWLYVPRGPISKASETSKSSEARAGFTGLADQLLSLAEQQGAVFIRIEPAEIPTSDGWRKAANDVQPRHTLVLDLTKGEEELLSEMHQKTRYNIRLAEKRGVRIRFSSDPADLDHFLRLSKDVHSRSAFSYHPDHYYRAMSEALSPTQNFEIALAEYEGQALAAHILVSFGDTVTYVHGASSSSQRELMAPHLLQWESIKRAKSAGYRTYDFFGVKPPEADEKHSWSGITRFKEGFGGQRITYPGAYDYVLDPVWYWTYSTSRKLRRFRR